MRERRQSRPSFWRSGLLVLGLYAMLLQAFFGAIGGGAQAGVVTLDGSVGVVICSSGGGEAPHTPHAHTCICPALCHAGVFFAPAEAVAEVLLLSVFVVVAIRRLDAPRSTTAAGGNSARGPPHEPIIVFA